MPHATRGRGGACHRPSSASRGKDGEGANLVVWWEAPTFDCRAPGAGLLAPMLRRHYDATTRGATQGAYASPHPDRAGPQGERRLVRAPRVSGSDDGAEGGALERMGRAARAREGCLGQWEKGCGGVEVGHQCRGRTSGRAPPVPRQRRAHSRLTMPLSQGHGRQPLTPEGAPPAARARGVREEIVPLSHVRGTRRKSRVLSTPA